MLTLDLPKLYSPVAADFQRYEQAFLAALECERPEMADLVAHVSAFRGKQLRPALVFLCCRATGAEVSQEHIHAGIALELIHTATLVHDDVLDDSDQRRSLPTVNSRWGTEAAVLLGDFLFATAYSVAAAAPTPHTARVLARATQIVCTGEVVQLDRRGDPELDRSTHLEIITAKTATLYRAACELGAFHAGASAEQVEALSCYGREIGVAFQIADDLLDLLGEEEETGKSLGTDLEMGTATLPVLHALEEGDALTRERIGGLLARASREARSELREILEPLGSFDYARRAGIELIERARARLDALPETPARESLAGIAEYVLERKL